ncbi:MAG TPA: ATP-binding protein [Steroidobacteraceae bacterium]|nr:ATP-binding protein [Steroidobacteraceae bacterium]
MRKSLEGGLALFAAALVAAAALATALLASWLDSVVYAAIVALVFGVPPAIWLGRVLTRPVARTLQAISDGIAGIKDRDFSASVRRSGFVELDALVTSYNALGDALRRERQGLYQRELLLDTVIQSTPLAMLLTNQNGAVIYSNVAARALFAGGRKLEGRALASVVDGAPSPLRDAILSRTDGLYTIADESEPQAWHLSCRRFVLNTRPHDLYLLKQLTRELARQEVATWKRVIRVIAHELNNSLAPISSLAHSGLVIADRGAEPQLRRIFTTIEDRARRLHEFIDGYARFAKLPQPRVETVTWSDFLATLGAAVDFRISGSVPQQPAHFDPAQIEQVLINLIKNAHEGGSPPADVELDVGRDEQGWRITVRDRGCGMSEAVLRQALLPFYSTKPAGTGLGLPLCREIVEAHGGRLALANRDGGGLAVTLWLPGAAGAGMQAGSVS